MKTLRKWTTISMGEVNSGEGGGVVGRLLHESESELE